METLIVHLENAKKAAAVKSVMKALDVEFEIKKKRQAVREAKALKESPYDPEFVAKIERSRKDFKEGKGIKMTIQELKALCK